MVVDRPPKKAFLGLILLRPQFPQRWFPLLVKSTFSMLEHASIIKGRKRQNRNATMDLPFPIRSNASNIRLSREEENELLVEVEIGHSWRTYSLLSSSLSLSLSLIWIFGKSLSLLYASRPSQRTVLLQRQRSLWASIRFGLQLSGQSPHKGPQMELLI